MDNPGYQYLARELESVVRKLKSRDYRVITEQTCPYHRQSPRGKKRVIAIQQLDRDTRRVIWSYERYE